ncbi:MAG: hypothetical protein EOO33_08910 [Comamonadaceae bacterium]|nr:MAG: hypothetical protein EOO33_08910 [Comamonadaceae bacterium]
MRKTFQLNIEGKNRDRLLDAARRDIHRYLKRERRRDVPAGFDVWAFDCRFGTSESDAQTVALEDIKGLIDGVAESGGTQFYVELLARGAARSARPASDAGASPLADDQDADDEGGD